MNLRPDARTFRYHIHQDVITLKMSQLDAMFLQPRVEVTPNCFWLQMS